MVFVCFYYSMSAAPKGSSELSMDLEKPGIKFGSSVTKCMGLSSIKGKHKKRTMTVLSLLYVTHMLDPLTPLSNVFRYPKGCKSYGVKCISFIPSREITIDQI